MEVLLISSLIELTVGVESAVGMLQLGVVALATAACITCLVLLGG